MSNLFKAGLLIDRWLRKESIMNDQVLEAPVQPQVEIPTEQQQPQPEQAPVEAPQPEQK